MLRSCGSNTTSIDHFKLMTMFMDVEYVFLMSTRSAVLHRQWTSTCRLEQQGFQMHSQANAKCPLNDRSIHRPFSVGQLIEEQLSFLGCVRDHLHKAAVRFSHLGIQNEV